MMKEANIIVLAGQSNAVGVGYTQYLENHFDKKDVDKFYDGYDNTQIRYVSHDIISEGFTKTRVNCAEETKETFGPEVGIAKKLEELFPKEKFFIVKCAFGATNLYSNWRSPSSGDPYCQDTDFVKKEDIVLALSGEKPLPAGWCYNELVKVLQNSIEELKTKGYIPKLRVFAWVQGEADAYFEEATDKYISRFNFLMSDIESTFSDYIDNWAVIDIGISDYWKYYEKMNFAKKDNAQKKGYYYFSPKDLMLSAKNEPHDEPDLCHYDSDSVIRLGEKIASVFCDKIKNEK